MSTLYRLNWKVVENPVSYICRILTQKSSGSQHLGSDTGGVAPPPSHQDFAWSQKLVGVGGRGIPPGTAFSFYPPKSFQTWDNEAKTPGKKSPHRQKWSGARVSGSRDPVLRERGSFLFTGAGHLPPTLTATLWGPLGWTPAASFQKEVNLLFINHV